MKLATTFYLFVCAFTLCSLTAQEMPPIQTYLPEIYGGDNQNWSISQTKNRFIYVGNNMGLLEFNGAKWKLYNSPSGIIRSVQVIDNLIYTGSYKEFGFWKKNNYGELKYESLSKKLKVNFLNDEEFWNIIALDDWILFQSLKRIYIYNKSDGSYSVINSDTDIYKMFKINDTIYFQKAKNGLYKIEKGEAVAVSNAQEIKNNLLVNIFNYNGDILIQTENNGFYLLKNNTISVWNTSINNLLTGVSVYRSMQLQDQSFIIGTRSDGVFHISPQGYLLETINTTNGLSNNTIHYIFQDADKNIWLALENGINCINITSPFRIYHDTYGKLGTVYASKIVNNYFYLGTNQGLFCKPVGTNEPFQLIKGTEGVVRCLVWYDNTLFCGHNLGTFIVTNTTANLVIDIEGTWNIIPIRENLLLQGSYNGLNVIEKINNQWTLRNKISGFNTSSKFFELVSEKDIIVSHEYEGVYLVKVDSNFTKAIHVTKILNVGTSLKSSVVKHHNDIFYAYQDGIYKYNKPKKIFLKDRILSQFFTSNTYRSGVLISDTNNDILWWFSQNNLNYATSSNFSNKQKVKSIPFSESLPRGLSGYENILHLNNQTYLIGTSSGYLSLNLNKFFKKSYNISINAISQSDLNANQQIVSIQEEGFFKNKNNNIEISYSVPHYDRYTDTEYQYKLEGIYPEWTSWTTSATTSFKNLPFGSYVFKVRAKVGHTITNNIASYSFKIDRPWYISNTMIALYALFLIFFSLLMHTIYKRYYKKQREKLLQQSMRDLELKELENKQQQMRYNNDKLRQDIDNKNRELEISTISLIKKNEFLNNVKKELNKIEEPKYLKNVIKIIDKNINNTDDWNLFEEAFNNADKEFLKKIKQSHPTLTHNDLRLCAYLRLNLSSKEIAPLLNISARSVEVKRYRLRKKMNLPHESSLTDYILEI